MFGQITKTTPYNNNNNNGDFLLGAYIVASELKDPIWHSSEWQIGSFSSEATIYTMLCELHLFIYVSFQLPLGTYGTAAISALGTYRTHYHLCPTTYSFTPKWSEVHEDKVPYRKKKHWNTNAPALRGERHDISLISLHQATIELARQIAVIAKPYALTIVPRPSRNIS